MVSIIKNVCIFMIIAQAVLFFVPGENYMKYVRVLVGIIIILRITEPLIGFLTNEESGEGIERQLQEWTDGVEYGSFDMEIEDGSMGIYSGIEEELKGRLDACESNYEVKAVELVGDSKGENMGIAVTVTPKEDANGTDGGDGGKTGEKIQIAPIVIGEKQAEIREEEKTAADEKKLQELKELYGSCIGVDPGKVEIRYEAG